MGCKVETKTGELIKAETSYASAYGAQMKGYIQGYKGECGVSFSGGGTIYVDSGFIVWDGKNIQIDDDGLQYKLEPETGPDKTYYVFLVIDMKSGDGKLAVEDSTNPPGFVQDDLFLNYADGVCWILIGDVINTDTGLNGSERTIKPLTGAEKLFEGNAAIGNTIDLKYSVDILMSAKHIDLKLELLNIKLQGIVAILSINLISLMIVLSLLPLGNVNIPASPIR